MAEEIDLQDLVVRYLDDALTSDEQSQLNELLRRDPQRRRRFVEACLQASLIREMGAQTRAERPRRRWPAVAVGGLAVAATVALFLLRGEPPKPPVAALPPPPPVDAQDRVAIVSNAESAVWRPGSTPVVKGQVLGRGRIELVSGKARIDFFSGAKVVLTGPAVLDLISPRRGFLHSGSASARVHQQAVGFVLGSPGAKVFDLGTEFALTAHPAGTSDVRVFDGEVEASVLGTDGVTVESTIVGADRRLVIDPRAAALREEAATGGERVSAEQLPPLAITPAYVESVLAARPVAYWRFERMAAGVVPNEVGPTHPLRVVGDVASAGGPANRVAAFSPEVRDRSFVSDDFADLCSQDFSVELWVNPESIREMSLASLVVTPRLVQPTWVHLALLELRALEGRFSHAPGAVRYLHRWPPGPSGGVNVFSSEPYRPGIWHHLAGVRRGTTMSLYLDGRLIRTVPIPEARKPLPIRVVLGILPTFNMDDQRHFVGWMDEVAVFDRALGAEEIAARHRMVSP